MNVKYNCTLFITVQKINFEESIFDDKSVTVEDFLN